MRRLFTSGMMLPSTVSCGICLFSAALWIGDSGGMYHTIGSVRYSGCSGKATSQSTAIRYTGDLRAASSHVSGMPSLRAASITSGSFGSRKHSSWALYSCFSSGMEAAASMRSASYSITPR